MLMLFANGLFFEEKKTIGSDIFSEFLEVSIHMILYSRRIYPHGVFERRKKYNVPVQTCLHPDVNNYIAQIIKSVKTMVASGEVSMITLVIIDTFQIPLERFVFELCFPSSETSSDKYLFRLEDALRGFLLRLNTADSMLKPLPQGCTWAIHVHTKESTADQFVQQKQVQDFSWVPVDAEQTQLNNPAILPLKAANTPMFKMQLYVEESANKPD